MEIQKGMSKYSTKQLQDALKELYKANDVLASIAYRFTFDELHRRMGDEAFDKFIDAVEKQH